MLMMFALVLYIQSSLRAFAGLEGEIARLALFAGGT